MVKHPFKTSGIARTGFEYQDLIGIEVLLRFFRDPELFHWIELESEEPSTGALDDIVAARADNSFDLLQVKFTADPNAYLLDWTWLLAKKKGGTSLLFKWATALNTIVSLGPVHSAKLRTNRRPDGVFAKSLHNGFVTFDKIPRDVRKAIAAELGGTTAARAFFSTFEFSHSESLIDDLEARLRGQIVPTDTDATGWLLLREAARRWAIRRKLPEPDGKIRHEHLVQIINKRRPKPIPQDFEIPVLYQVPSNVFHTALLERINSGSRPNTVLWGSPGRGKSTYLSYLVDALLKAALPSIRHHYFLSLNDDTVDRISFSDISSSLMHQIASRCQDAVLGLDDQPNNLRKWIEACGLYYAKEGKRFYVVIDGLDHVWREQRNTAQMEHLFNYLLPCPPNVMLLVGTQRVAREQLPLKLLQLTTTDDWIEIPPLDESAVHTWIAGQKKAGRLLLPDLPHHSDEASALSQVGSAFYGISNGNPLHLIYSFEALVRRGVAVTADEVTLLPACPDGDIREYYGGLWGKLPTFAKKVLHLIAGSEFSWPAEGLRQCAGSLDEVDHLIEHRRSGLIPFHGSILAYVRDQPDHEDTFRALLPVIVKWLQRSAPEYWRWAWLWIMRARLGDEQDLLSKTTRSWVIKSLVEGWPSDQVVTILTDAESRAFERGDYSRTIELRSLRVRMLNGRDYQTNRFRDFEESAIRLSHNQPQVLRMADAIGTSDEKHIVTLMRCLSDAQKESIGNECYDELRRRVNISISFRPRANREFPALVDDFLEALVNFGAPDVTKLLRFIEQFGDQDQFFATLLRHIVRVRNFEMALELLALLEPESYSVWRHEAQDAMVRLAGHEGIDLSLRIGPQRTVSPLMACWYQVKGFPLPGPCSIAGISTDAVRENYDAGGSTSLETFFHSFFFGSLLAAFEASGESSPALIGIDRTKLGWMTRPIDVLWETALGIAAHSMDMDFGSVFLGMADLAPVEDLHRHSEPSTAQYRALRLSARRIAKDLHSLKSARDGATLVTKATFELARASTHWLDHLWIADELETRSLMFEAAAVKEVVDAVEATQATTVTQFDERAETWTDLALLSVLYDLDGTRFVARAADCIIGYGWRKDLWMLGVLSAMEAVHESGAADIGPLLGTLAPIVDQITVFTDGDETRHVREEFIDLVAKARPDWLPQMYAYYIAREEWHLAERALARILCLADLASVSGTALVRSLLDRTDIRELDDLRKQGKARAGELARSQRAFLGSSSRGMAAAENAARRKASDSSADLGNRGRPPKVEKFGPDELERLLTRVSSPKLGYLRREDALVRWMKHWDGKRKGIEVLNSLSNYFASHDNPHEIERLLDEAFNLSLKYQGKSKAYVWLVRAHIERNGWSLFWEKASAVQRRLELAASIYRHRWAEFIYDTSKPGRYWEKRRTELTIGTSWLVRFLVMAGQHTEALKFTEAMVRITTAEVSDQPIPVLEWMP